MPEGGFLIADFAPEQRSQQPWARRGSRPSAPHDQRTASTCIFGAICPQQGKGAGLVLPSCNTQAMTLHLAEIATEVTPGSHAVLLLDLLDHCCDAWNKLVDQPWHIMTIGLRDWAHRF